MKREPIITFAELMSEVRKFKCKPNSHKFIPTKEQMLFVSEARKKNMNWDLILTLWKKWGGMMYRQKH